MGSAHWVDVWNLALSVAAHEPVTVQIALGLAAALAATLCIEGLYASLFPARYGARLARSYSQNRESTVASQRDTSTPARTLAPVPVQKYRPLKIDTVKRSAATNRRIRQTRLVNPPSQGES